MCSHFFFPVVQRWLKQAMEEVDSTNQQGNATLASPANNGQSSSPEAQTTAAVTSTISNTNSDTPISPGSTPATALGSTPAPLLTSASSSHTDFVTPLKKRRMARESLSLESQQNSLDSHPTSPENSNPLVTPVVKSENPAPQQQTLTAMETSSSSNFMPPPEESANHAVLDMKPTPSTQENSDTCISSPSKQSNMSQLNEQDVVLPTVIKAEQQTEVEGSESHRHVPIPVTEQDEVVPETVSRFSPVNSTVVSIVGSIITGPSNWVAMHNTWCVLVASC